MKEVHFLCLQLEKMFKEDQILKDAELNFEFNGGIFVQPTFEDEKVLQ